MNEQLMPSQWQLLNDLRRPDARLIYSRQRDAYFLHPLSRWVDRQLGDRLLADALVEQAGLTPGVYRVTARGRRMWARQPRDIEIEGVCDRCAHGATVRPHRQDGLCLFLCARCATEVPGPYRSMLIPVTARRAARAREGFRWHRNVAFDGAHVRGRWATSRSGRRYGTPRACAARMAAGRGNRIVANGAASGT